ncbi:hypothetical protein BC829DRAFT_410124 [Chytridium lagenaria]|nr:hypothetical protein BC829DRAFT_410124 [Chytridium lagenaria]
MKRKGKEDNSAEESVRITRQRQSLQDNSADASDAVCVKPSSEIQPSSAMQAQAPKSSNQRKKAARVPKSKSADPSASKPPKTHKSSTKPKPPAKKSKHAVKATTSRKRASLAVEDDNFDDGEGVEPEPEENGDKPIIEYMSLEDLVKKYGFKTAILPE